MAALGAMPALAQVVETVPVRVETREVVGPLPHICEECVGSDRAAISLRESWRQEIDRAKAELGIKRVRFHGIVNDELGVKTKTWLSRSGKTNFRDDAEVNLGTYQELGVRDFLISEGSMGWP